jgi:uncharacterized membrane protein YkoI
MKRNTKIGLTAALIAAIGSVGAAALARDSDPPSMADAGIGIVQAIAVAEQHANGKAARAEFEKSKGQWVYDVEVVSGAKAYDVKVDAAKGTVISSTEDKADADNDSDD